MIDMPKVVLASDIDKTLTDERGLIPDEVINYLGSLYREGWEIVLLTGRTFSYAMMSLKKIDFPFYLAVQNGAEVLYMPSKEIIFQNFLPKSVAYYIDGLYRECKEDFLIYAGLEKGDFCYYRTSKFSQPFLTYLEKLKRISSSEWIEVEDMADVAQPSFPLIKCLGELSGLQRIQVELEQIQMATSSLILDSVHPSLPLLLVTHQEVDKGLIFKKIRARHNWACPIVAAGDDRNDIPLFKQADMCIAMSNAPSELKSLATIVTKSSYELGIISALEEIKSRLGQP